jgi:hypothetical protein
MIDLLSSSALSSSPAMSSPALREKLSRLLDLQGEFYTVSPSRLVTSPGSYSSFWEDYSPLEEGALSYLDLESSAGRHIGYWKASPEELLESFCQERLWKKATIVFCPSFFSSGDYSGSLVELSNLQCWIEDYGKLPGVWELYGGHGSSGLALDVRFITEDMLEALESLQNYPVMDEDHLSHLELEKEQEAWESWAREDFRKALTRKLPEALGLEEKDDEETTLLDLVRWERAEEKLEELTDDKLYSLLYEAMERANLYWETETTSRYLDVKEAAEAVNPEALLEALGGLEA